MVKQFYSCIDSLIPCPQPEQHSTIEAMARKCGGKITYSTSEDSILRNTQVWIEERVERINNLDGLIFFTVTQFYCRGEFNTPLLERLLAKNLEVHFARESLTFQVPEDTSSESGTRILMFLSHLSAI